MIDWRAATSADALRAVGDAMNESLRHRGPDGSGVWVEAEGGAMLAQRWDTVAEQFAPGAFEVMSDPQKLTRAAFEPMDAGVAVGTAQGVGRGRMGPAYCRAS